MYQSFSVDSQIKRIITDLNALPEQVQQASILALNRTAEWMKGQTAKEISAEKRLKLKAVRDRITLAKANKRNPQATLSCNFKSVYVKNLSNVRQTPVGVVAGGVIYCDFEKRRKTRSLSKNDNEAIPCEISYSVDFR